MNLWKVILAAFVLYLAGIVTGFFAADSQTKKSHDVHEKQRPPMRDIMRRMESRLKLSAEQREKVSAILKARQERMRSLMDKVRPQIEAEGKAMREQIQALLSEEQMAQFNEVFRRRGMRSGHGLRPMRGNGRHERESLGTTESSRPQRQAWDAPPAEVEAAADTLSENAQPPLSPCRPADPDARRE